MSAESAYPTAIVREVNGQLVLDDPVARSVFRAVAKHNCLNTFSAQADRVIHFARRMGELGRSPRDVVIVLLNVDDQNGKMLANILMPGHDWQAIRDRGEVPFARGLAGREGIQEALAIFDREAAMKLTTMEAHSPGSLQPIGVVVVDHGVAEVVLVNASGMPLRNSMAYG